MAPITRSPAATLSTSTLQPQQTDDHRLSYTTSTVTATASATLIATTTTASSTHETADEDDEAAGLEGFGGGTLTLTPTLDPPSSPAYHNPTLLERTLMTSRSAEKSSPTLPFPGGGAWLRSPGESASSQHLRPPATASSMGTTTGSMVSQSRSRSRSRARSVHSSSGASTVTHIAPAAEPMPTYLALQTLPGNVLTGLVTGAERLTETTKGHWGESSRFLKQLKRERDRRARRGGGNELENGAARDGNAGGNGQRGGVRKIGRKVRGKLAGLLHCMDKDAEGGSDDENREVGGGDGGLVEVPSCMWDHARGYLVTETHYREKLQKDMGSIVPAGGNRSLTAPFGTAQSAAVVALALAVDKYLSAAERWPLDPVQKVTRDEVRLVTTATPASWALKHGGSFLVEHTEIPTQYQQNQINSRKHNSTLQPPAIPKSPSAIFLQTYKPLDDKWHVESRLLEETCRHHDLQFLSPIHSPLLPSTYTRSSYPSINDPLLRKLCRHTNHAAYILQEALLCLRRVRCNPEFPWTVYNDHQHTTTSSSTGYHHRHLIRSRWASEDRPGSSGSTLPSNNPTPPSNTTTKQELRLLLLLSHLARMVYALHTHSGTMGTIPAMRVLVEGMRALRCVHLEWTTMRAWDTLVAARMGISGAKKSQYATKAQALIGNGREGEEETHDHDDDKLLTVLEALGFKEELSMQQLALGSFHDSKSVAGIERVVGVDIREWGYRALEVFGNAKVTLRSEAWWFEESLCGDDEAEDTPRGRGVKGKEGVGPGPETGDCEWVEKLVSGLSVGEAQSGLFRLVDPSAVGTESEKASSGEREKANKRKSDQENEKPTEPEEQLGIVLAAARQARSRRGRAESEGTVIVGERSGEEGNWDWKAGLGGGQAMDEEDRKDKEIWFSTGSVSRSRRGRRVGLGVAVAQEDLVYDENGALVVGRAR